MVQTCAPQGQLYFLHKAHHNLLALRNTRQHFSNVLDGHLRQKITNTEHKTAKKYGTKYSVKKDPKNRKKSVKKDRKN